MFRFDLIPPSSRDPADGTQAPVAPIKGTPGTLTERTLEAGRWRMATLLGQMVLQFGAAIVLARLLRPEDFGLAGLAMVVVVFVGVLAEAGMSSALIYRRPLSTRDVRVAFTFSMAVALALSSALALLAPYVAAPFRQDSLAVILRAQAPLFILAAVGSTARGLLRRRLDFRRLFLVDVGSYFLGYTLVAVTLAANGFGVWSLVVGALAQAGLGSALALGLAPHPLRPLFVTRDGLQLLSYGGANTLNSVVAHVGRSADSLVIGRLLGTAELGLYTRAFSLFSVPISYMSMAMTSVLFPVMSEIQDDRARSRTGYYLGVQLMTMIAAPVSAAVIVAAPHLVVGLYGERWLGAALPLQILASAGTLRAVYNLGAAVTQSSGNVMAEVRRQTVLAVLLFTGAVIGTQWGIAGVSLGVLAGMLFMYFAMAHLTLRILKGSWPDFLAAHIAGLTLGLQVGLVALVVRLIMDAAGAGSLTVLVALAVTCAVALPLAIRLLPGGLRPTDLLFRLGTSLSGLPVPVQRSVTWMLRLR